MGCVPQPYPQPEHTGLAYRYASHPITFRNARGNPLHGGRTYGFRVHSRVTYSGVQRLSLRPRVATQAGSAVS